MNFTYNKHIESLGMGFGYAFGYFSFTTALFLLLFFSHRLPSNWTYFHIMFITLIIVLSGLGLKRLLR